MSTGVLVAVWALIFIIVTFGAVAALIVIYQRARRGPAGSALQPGDRGFEREAKIFTLYQNLEDMLDGFDAYVEETRVTFEKEKAELLRQREEIAQMHAAVLAISTKMEQRLRSLEESNTDAPKSAPVLPDAVLITTPPSDDTATPSPPKPETRSEARPGPEPTPPRQPAAKPTPLFTPPEPRFMPVKPERLTARPSSPGGGRAATIQHLQEQGMSAEDIAQEMGISRNEVTLTLKLLGEE